MACSLRADTYFLTVSGLGGEQEYEQRFSGWAKDLDKLLRAEPGGKVELLQGKDATKVNIEANHATLSGHSFEHEIATAGALGILGSLDMNRGDPQLGWDTDQFPNDLAELSLVVARILDGGGFTTGGFNFDAKVRRMSSDPIDLFHAHVGGMDNLARALLIADRMLADGQLKAFVEDRYAGWKGELGSNILLGKLSLEELAAHVQAKGLDPKHRSGRQEFLENLVNRYL